MTIGQYTCLNPEQLAVACTFHLQLVVAWKFHLQLNLAWKFNITLAVAGPWELQHASAEKYPCQCLKNWSNLSRVNMKKNSALHCIIANLSSELLGYTVI